MALHRLTIVLQAAQFNELGKHSTSQVRSSQAFVEMREYLIAEIRESHSS